MASKKSVNKHSWAIENVDERCLIDLCPGGWENGK